MSKVDNFKCLDNWVCAYQKIIIVKNFLFVLIANKYNIFIIQDWF